MNQTKGNRKAMKILTEVNPKLSSSGLLLLRAAIGFILFIVGAGKVFGWFGGFGLEITVQSFVKMGITPPLAYLSMFTEFIGGILLIIGLLTRPAAFAVAINMTVAFLFMLPRGFITGMAAYPFSLAVIAFALILTGPGELSIDHVLFGREE